jgi:hypothetical protein
MRNDGYPFIVGPDRAVDDPDLSDAAYRLLSLICRFINNNNQAWPSNKLLAEKLKVTTRAITKQMKVLVEKGYIQSVSRFSKNGARLSNIISVVWDDGKRVPIGDIPEESGEDQNEDPYSTSVHPPMELGVHIPPPPGVLDNRTIPTRTSSSRAQPSENSQDEKGKLAKWIKYTAPGVEIHMDEINYWLDEGCDIENHIKPIIKRMVLRAIENDQTIGSIYYFRKAILNIKNKKSPKASEPKQSEQEFAANNEDLLKSTKELCDHPAWHAMCEWALKTFGYRDFFSYFSRPVGVKVDEDTDLLRISVEGGYTRQHWNENYKEDLEQIAYENGLDGVEIS